MPRHNELEKTWLPGPSRGTQTFNAPANLTIDYGRHVATVSGRGGSGNNPGAQYSILYSTNYNVVYPQGNQPEASRPVIGNNTNYNTVYPIDTQPEASRPITGYNLNYNIAYPVAATPQVYNILYNLTYNVVPVADTYGANYNLAYPIAYNVAYPVFYNSVSTAAYNRVDTAVYNIAYPVFYNAVTSPFYNAVFGTVYNVVTAPGTQPEASRPATAYSILYNTNYNAPSPPNWSAALSIDGSEIMVGSEPITIFSPGGAFFTSDWFGVAPTPGPVSVTGAITSPDYGPGTAYIVYSEIPGSPGNVANQPEASRPINAYDILYNQNYNISYPVSYNATYPIAYNVAYPIAYNVAYPISYNVAYPIFYNVSYPVAYNVVYPAFYNQVSVFVSNNTNYNVIYPFGPPQEASRPVIGNNTNYNIVYPPGTTPAVYNILYNTNYNVAYPVASYGFNYSILYNTNYNVAYPQGNQPEASRPIVGYSPGVPGTPTNVLGVDFPGGAVGSLAPYIPETVVRYWDYPDFQTHPVVVPSGGEITVKLE